MKHFIHGNHSSVPTTCALSPSIHPREEFVHADDSCALNPFNLSAALSCGKDKTKSLGKAQTIVPWKTNGAVCVHQKMGPPTTVGIHFIPNALLKSFVRCVFHTRVPQLDKVCADCICIAKCAWWQPSGQTLMASFQCCKPMKGQMMCFSARLAKDWNSVH